MYKIFETDQFNKELKKNCLFIRTAIDIEKINQANLPLTSQSTPLWGPHQKIKRLRT